MPKKPIIDIEINDSKFLEFYKKYEEWRSSTKESVEDIDAISKSLGGNSETFSRVNKAAQNLDRKIKSSEKAMREFSKAVGDAKREVGALDEKSNQLRRSFKKGSQYLNSFAGGAKRAYRQFHKMEKASENIFKSLFKAGRFMLKLGLIGGGIGAFAGLFGLSELARNSVSAQRSARGLGLNQGNVRAFDVDYSNFVSPGLLNSVAQAQSSFKDRVWLQIASGLNNQQVTNLAPDQLAQRLIMSAHQWWVSTPASQRVEESPKAKAFQAAGLSWEDVRRLGNTPEASLQRANRRYAQDAKGLYVGSQTSRSWYQLTRQLSFSKNKLETFLATQLHSLGPALAKVIGGLTKDVEKIISTTLTPKNVQAFADGLASAGKFLASPEFMKDLQNFQHAIVDLTQMIIKAAHFLGIDTKQDAKNKRLLDAQLPAWIRGKNTPSPYAPTGISGAARAPRHTKIEIHSHVSGLTVRQINAATK